MAAFFVVTLPGLAEPPAPQWPKTVCSAGAMVPARLSPWKVDGPTDYSGHYVSASVTDGSVDLLVTVRRADKDTSVRWFVDVYERDDRDGPENEDRYHVDCPLIEQPLPAFALGGGGPMMFFALDESGKDRNAKPARILVAGNGDYYVLKPRVPEVVVLGGKELPAKFKPWMPADPAAYAGRYLSPGSAKGSSQLDIVIRHLARSRVPWRIDTHRKDTTPGEENDEYSYRDRPLWQNAWPHVDAYDTYLFVEFADPRNPGTELVPAAITEKGEVLIKQNRGTQSSPTPRSSR